MVYHLSAITERQSLQLLIWCVSLLAIGTSIIGVGRGLYDTLSFYLKSKISNKKMLSLGASVLTILPAYLVAALVPNAFIQVLGFAGDNDVEIHSILHEYDLPHEFEPDVVAEAEADLKI